MHLGNINYNDILLDDVNSCLIMNKNNEINKISDLLKINKEDLKKCLLFKTLTINSSLLSITLSKNRCIENRFNKIFSY